MIKRRYLAGRDAALHRFKMSNMALGAAGYNPTLNGQAPTPSAGTAMGGSLPRSPAPATPAAPVAAGAGKSRVLG